MLYEVITVYEELAHLGVGGAEGDDARAQVPDHLEDGRNGQHAGAEPQRHLLLDLLLAGLGDVV